jgi:hypothetical protein
MRLLRPLTAALGSNLAAYDRCSQISEADCLIRLDNFRFGRKIEKAVKYRESGVRLAIVGEEHWAAALD